MADLLPIHARFERAQHHVADLQRVLGEYIARPPFHRTKRAGPARDRIVERAELVAEPPIEAAMIVSDAVHQARAALDNLVNALRPDGPAPGVYFPIPSTEAAYVEAVAGGALRGVPDWARDAIAALQPWSTDLGRWAGDQLPNLHELAKLDRHRLPLLHAALVVPDYAAGDDPSIVARADPGWRWAEWEYDARSVVRVAFKVEVQFGPESGQPPGVEVADWTRYLVERATMAVDMVMRSANPA